MKNIDYNGKLRDDDCRIYETLLRLGQVSDRSLAADCGIALRAVRNALRRLTAQGVVSVSRRDGFCEYVAEPLSMFIDSLKAYSTSGKPVSTCVWNKIRISTNKKATLAAIESELSKSKVRQCVEMTDISSMFRVIKRAELAGMRRVLRKNKVHIRGIYTKHMAIPHPLCESFIIAPEFTGLCSNIGVYGDCLVLTSFKKGMNTVMINDESLVNSFRTLFEYAYFGLDRLKCAGKK